MRGTWDNNRLNGTGTIQLAGKFPVDVIFKEDIIIKQEAQEDYYDSCYFVTVIPMMLNAYLTIILFLLGFKTIFLYILILVIYICASYKKNSTWYIFNTVDMQKIFGNIDTAIAARPICKFTIQNYHYNTKHSTD